MTGSNQPIVRPATREDIERFGGGEVVPSVTAFVGELDGKLIGLGGLAHAGGKVTAFLNLKPEARMYRKSLHRAALMMLEAAKAGGHRYVYAAADPNEPTADRWLRRLGFAELEPGKYRWPN